MIRALLIGVAVIIGLLVFNWVFWHVIGLLAILIWLAVTLAIVAGIGYLVYSLFQKNKSQPTAVINYKLFDTSSSQVRVYKFEPTIQDLVSSAAGQEAQPSSQAFTIANDTRVSILEDKGTESVKIKILDKDAREKVGWVARSALVRESQQISG